MPCQQVSALEREKFLVVLESYGLMYQLMMLKSRDGLGLCRIAALPVFLVSLARPRRTRFDLGVCFRSASSFPFR